MAGTFTLGETKVRPGSYFNIQKKGDGSVSRAINGIVGILFKSDWGPLNETVEIGVDEGYENIFGTGGTTDTIGLAFEGGAITALCCRVGSGGTCGSTKLNLASGDEAVAIASKYVGSKQFTITVRDKLSDDTLRECVIYDGLREFEKISFAKSDDEVTAIINAFSNSKNFIATKIGSANGVLKAVSQKEMTPGTDPTTNVQDYSNGFEAMEPYFMNTVCVDTNDKAVHGLLNSFLDRIFDVGQMAIGVIGEKKSESLENRIQTAASYNSEKIVYVLNGSLLSTTYGEIDGYQTAAKVAGMIASCPSNSSLTHTVLDKITVLHECLTPTQINNAELSGCLVLSFNKSKQIWIDNAINTLVTLAENQDEGWKKIRRTKTRYEMLTRMNNQADSLVGSVDNDTNGRATLISQLQAIGTAMIEEGKLTACTVTESSIYKPDGDSAWFEIDCIDKDSAEHIYLMYAFRFSTQE